MCRWFDPVPRHHLIIVRICESGSAVEHRLAKARVAGSIPVFRSIEAAWPSGKAKVCNTYTPGPNPGAASINFLLGYAEVAELADAQDLKSCGG